MLHLHSFSEFLFEGGRALESTRPIKQSEVPLTMRAIERTIFPVLGLEDWNKDVLLIGSAGRKLDPEETSGDMDLGVVMDLFAKKHGTSPERGLEYLYLILKTEFPEWEFKWMKGLEVVSLAFPIEGDVKNGYVQVDFLPLKDMEWASFIYYSPDYRKGESKYKSAHRNWLFAAILSAIIEEETFDDAGNKLGFAGYMMRLNDGLSRIRKSFGGKRGLLKNPKMVKDEEKFITRSPKEFVEFLFGPGFVQEDVRTTEQVINIITGADFKWKDKRDEIVSNYKRFLGRVKLEVPSELK
jgi:hypothetical protein